MAFRKLRVEREPIRRRRMLRLLASATLPLILVACAAQRSAPQDPRLGQLPASRGGRS